MRKRKDLKFAERIAKRVDELGECANVHYAEGDMRFGEMLKAWRFKNDKHIGDIATEMGINITTAKRLEAGKQQPDLLTALRIMVWLFSDEFGIYSIEAMQNLYKALEEKNGIRESTPRVESIESPAESGDGLETILQGGN